MATLLPLEDLITTRRPYYHCEKTEVEMVCHGHITKSTGLAKMILQGTVQGGRRKGRKSDGKIILLSKWTGLGWGEAIRKAEDREK